MFLTYLLSDTVTRLRAPIADGGYGNAARDWNNATSADLACHVSSVSSTEDVVNLNETQTRIKVTLHASADVEPTDRILYRGLTYECDGDVMFANSLRGLHHQRVIARRVEISDG